MEDVHFVNHSVGILPLVFREFVSLNCTCVSVISFVLNFAFAYILLTEQNPALRVYCKVLLQNCVIDLFFTAADFLTQVEMEFQEGQMMFIVSGALFRGKTISWHYIAIFCYLLSVAFTIHIVTVIFYFRYLLICKGVTMSMWQVVRFTCMILTPVIIEIGALVYALVLHESERPELCRRLLDTPMFWEEEEIIYVQSFDNSLESYEQMAPSGHKVPLCMFGRLGDPYIIMFALGVIITDTVYYAIMFYSTHHVFRVTNETRASLAKTRNVQRQMNYLLFAQMTLPLFTGFIPSATMITLMALHTHEPGLGLFITLTFSWLPIINPLTTIFLVTNFRRKFLRIFSGKYFMAGSSITRSSITQGGKTTECSTDIQVRKQDDETKRNSCQTSI